MTTFTSRGVPMAENSDAADIAARVNAVADVVHDRPGVSALTTVQRDALSGSDLWDGRVILNTTTDQLQSYDLATTTWDDVAPEAVFTPYTPALTGFTVTNQNAYHCAIGDHVTVSYRALVAGVTGQMQVAFPFPAARVPISTLVLGSCFAGDVSVGNAYGIGTAYIVDANKFGFVSEAGVWQGAIPFAWAAGDTLSFTLTYERA